MTVSGNAVAGEAITAWSPASITLPSATAPGQTIAIRSAGTNYGTTPVTVIGQNNIYGDGIDAANSFPIRTSGVSVVLHSDGASWNIIGGDVRFSYYAKSYRTAAFGITPNVWSVVPVNATPTWWDPDGRFLGGFYYPPTNGTYEVNGAVQVACASNPTSLEIGVMQFQAGSWVLLNEGLGGTRIVSPNSIDLIRAQISTTIVFDSAAGGDISGGGPLGLAINTNQASLYLGAVPGFPYNWISIRRVGP